MKAASISKQIDFYSRFSPSPLSMKQFIDFGKSGIKWIQFNMWIEQNSKVSKHDPILKSSRIERKQKEKFEYLNRNPFYFCHFK